VKTRENGVVRPQEEWKYYYYSYDANGQVMALYEVQLSNTQNTATLSEQHIYGASRLGMVKQDALLYDSGNELEEQGELVVNILGAKRYEITNYLGNVNAVITDRKIYASPGALTVYESVVMMKADYYPFGMTMPGRHESGEGYRFGYNGMELNPEVSGDGNSYTTEFRQYDPRLGRWLSLDPLMAQFPWMSPYVAFDNNPVFYVDPLGLKGDKPVKNVIYYNMVRQSDGSYLKVESHRHQNLRVRTSNAVLRNTKTKYTVVMQKKDWGIQQDKTYVYTYWNADGTINRQIVESTGLDEMAQPLPDDLQIYRSDGVTSNYEALFGLDDAIYSAMSAWADKNRHQTKIEPQSFPLERAAKLYQVQPGVYAMGSTVSGEVLDPSKNEGATDAVDIDKSTLKGYSDKSMVSAIHTHGSKRNGGHDEFSDNPHYDGTMWNGVMRDKNWARKHNVPLFLVLADCWDIGIFYPTKPEKKGNPNSGSEYTSQPSCNVGDW
jgi:RHS repeat-associated protein